MSFIGNAQENELMENNDGGIQSLMSLGGGAQIVRKKSFINRGDLMKNLRFPRNTPNLVVIPSNEKGTGFLRTCYDKDILENIIT